MLPDVADLRHTLLDERPVLALVNDIVLCLVHELAAAISVYTPFILWTGLPAVSSMPVSVQLMPSVVSHILFDASLNINVPKLSHISVVPPGAAGSTRDVHDPLRPVVLVCAVVELSQNQTTDPTL